MRCPVNAYAPANAIRIQKRFMVPNYPNRGLLFLIGGAEDRTGDKLILKTILDQTHAHRIVIIPTASGYPKDIFRTYDNAFRGLGTRDIRCLDIRYRDEADRQEYMEILEHADLVFFGGGDQVRLVDTLADTKALELIGRRFEAGQLHIAGTSAGAAAAGSPMIYHGNHHGLKKGSVEYSEGFGIISGVAIDTHFSARGRIARLSQFLISGHCKKGIGLDEDTGIMVCPNHQFQVIGSGNVTVLNSAKVSGSNYNTIAHGEKLRFNNMGMGILPPGSRFSLRKWAIMSRVGVNNRCLEPLLQWVTN